MGMGKADGSPYLCIAGLELYGVLTLSSYASCSRLSSLSLRLSTLRPPASLPLTEQAVTLKKKRAIYNALYKSTDFHVSLAKTCSGGSSSSMCRLCLELLTLVSARVTSDLSYIIPVCS
jgi:hypothetical protein